MKQHMASRQKWILMLTAALITAGFAVIQLGCQDLDPIGADGLPGGDEAPVDNEPPITHLSLNPDPGERPDTTTSAKKVNWWGEDPDGWVTAYLYRWGLVEEDTLGNPLDTAWYDENWALAGDDHWIQTDQESGNFILPIRTEAATFAFEVKAIDNYGSIDETPAAIAYPVINSPPSVDFRLSSNPTSRAGRNYYTFPIRSFVWDATDPDGNQTIANSYWALDPTDGDTNWVEVDGRENSVTIDEIEPGEHTFFLKVRDLAGFDSPTIQFPDSNVSTDPEAWVVKAPAPGGRLIVDDFSLDSGNEHLKFYTAIYDSVYGAQDTAYSVWELGTELPYVTADITQSLLMFDEIYWYTYYGAPQLRQAFNSMYTFINTPGNQMLLSTLTVDTGMVLDLAVDQYNSTPANILIDFYQDDPVYFVPEDTQTYPTMTLREIVGRSVIGLVPDTTSDAQVVYRLDPSTHSPPQYDDEPIICLQRPDKSYTLITVPLKTVNDRAEVAQFLQAVFDDD
jgi:hypothetical protein